MAGRRTAAVLLVLTALSAWASSCRASPATLTAGDADNPIAPEFKRFWEAAGGLATFGPPLEPPREQAGVLTQTFWAVQLRYDDHDRDRPIRLAPLGRALGLAEPSMSPSEGQSDRYFEQTGHTLYAGFAPLYDALGGLQVAGAPITEVQFRSGRITQYFENLGMVRLEAAAPSEVRLVPLGLASLPGSDFGANVDSLLLPGVARSAPPSTSLEAFGGEAVLGPPISDPYTVDDGSVEQIYERAVVVLDPSDMEAIAFRPIGLEFGESTPGVERLHEPGSIYDESTGHNVEWAFADFYREWDGPTFLGAPVEEARLDGSRLIQTFENGQLVYSYDVPADRAITLAPLGEAYAAAHPPPSGMPSPGTPVSIPTATPSRPEGGLNVEVELTKSVVDRSAIQVVTIRLTDADGDPLAGIEPRVTSYGPEGMVTDTASATDKKGRTSLRLQAPAAPSFQIITVIVTARRGTEVGTALVQYAIGWTPIP